MRSSIGDKERLAHILDSINEIEQAAAGMSKEEFLNNHVVRIAVVKWLEIIGEAANYITLETKSKANDLPWHQIIAFRNVAVHEYFGVEYEVVWKILETDLQQLKTEIERLYKDFE
jgi:uncharacterized protein with HEPN domain